MSVLNVLNTNSITATQSVYQRVNTGIYRVSATTASTVSFNDGPVIQLLAGQSVLLKGGSPGNVGITAATKNANAVYYLGDRGAGLTGNTHPFAVNDYIAVIDSPSVIDDAFESAYTAGKKITAVSPNAIVTNIDSSTAAADYVYAGGNQAYVIRCIKITAGAANIVVEEVQIVGG